MQSVLLLMLRTIGELEERFMKNAHKSSVERSLVAKERRCRIKEFVYKTGDVTVSESEEEFGICPITARRDPWGP